MSNGRYMMVGAHKDGDRQKSPMVLPAAQPTLTPLSLASVLKLDAFKAADAEVVAGTESLGRAVRWVHISDLPNSANSLKGGELLLTHGLSLSQDTRLQQKYIRELAAVGTTALVVELGRVFRELPTAMVGQARQLQFPLIALHKQILFLNVTEQVHAAIINRRYQVLLEVEKVGEELDRLASSGVGIRRTLEHLALRIGKSVVLEDHAHQVIEIASDSADAESLLNAWEVHARRVDHKNGMSSECVTGTVLLHGEPAATLHVLFRDGASEEYDHLVAKRAATAISLALLEASGTSGHGSPSGHVIADILTGRYVSSEVFLRRAELAGAGLSGRRLIAAVLDIADNGGREEPTLARRRTLDRLRGELERAVKHSGGQALVAPTLNAVYAVIGLPPTGQMRTFISGIAEQLPEPADASGYSPRRLRLGVSEVLDSSELRRAFAQAEEAAKLGSGAPVSVSHFSDLGISRMLLRLADGPELADFIEAQLGPVLSHDARATTPLLPFLREYVDSGSKSHTARARRVSRRSLYDRLDRIASLLGRQIEDPDVRASLMLALRGLDLLQARSLHGKSNSERQSSAARPYTTDPTASRL